jgi:hypothetical protein
MAPSVSVETGLVSWWSSCRQVQEHVRAGPDVAVDPEECTGLEQDHKSQQHYQKTQESTKKSTFSCGGPTGFGSGLSCHCQCLFHQKESCCFGSIYS